MGVKSTRRITRSEAENKYVDLKMADEAIRRKFRGEAVAMDNIELENKLEELNDKAHEGEGFENYIISEVPDRG